MALVLCFTTYSYHFSVPSNISVEELKYQAQPSFWGTPDGHFDWCEPNSPGSLVAEPLNTATSALYTIPVFVLFPMVYSTPLSSARFYASLASHISLAVGSILFHATLRYPAQLSDELPMVWVVLAACYAIYFRSGSCKLVGWLLAWYGALLTLGVLLTSRDSVEHEGFRLAMTLTFSIGFVYIFYGISKMSSDVEGLSRVSIIALATWVVAIGSWVVDIFYCDLLHSLSVPYPQLHAWGWHMGSSIGMYLFNLVVFTHRAYFLGLGPTIQWKFQFIPILEIAQAKVD